MTNSFFKVPLIILPCFCSYLKKKKKKDFYFIFSILEETTSIEILSSWVIIHSDCSILPKQKISLHFNIPAAFHNNLILKYSD